jgi:hypothetical protein
MDFHECIDGHLRSGSKNKCELCNPRKKHNKVEWSPFATNVLDAGDYELCKPDGSPVDFHRAGNGDFVLTIDGKRWETGDNTQMSYWMNQFEIGGFPKPRPAPRRPQPGEVTEGL